MSKRGFTLFELIVTISIISLALFPLLNALSITLLRSSTSRSELLAVNLGQAKMEEIKNSAYNNISSESKAIVPNFSAFQREVIVTTPNANLKDIKVFVYWTPSGKNEENLSFETYVANF